MRFLIACWLLAAPAAGAFAQLEVWEERGEKDLHAKGGGSMPGKGKDVLATCDAQGNLFLPLRYYLDYNLTPDDQKAFDQGLRAAKRYLRIEDALRDGYLPSARGYDPGFGLPLLHPKLLTDGTYDLSRPDVLSYIKREDEDEYRLVGLTYVAGKTEPPQMRGVDFSEKSRKPNAAGRARTEPWDFEEKVCIIVRPGRSVETYYGRGIPKGCAGGLYLDRLWRMYAWPLVYNPEGMFHEANPVVDFLDRKQQFGALCSGKARR